MRVVLQLERFGDLVQSLPAIDLVAGDRDPAAFGLGSVGLSGARRRPACQPGFCVDECFGRNALTTCSSVSRYGPSIRSIQ